MVEVTWTNCSVLKLIEEYKARPQLWDSNHESYRVLSIKYDSWQELADMFECDIGCIRKKLNSLFASHRREKAKVKYGGKSTWFLYPYLSFLPTHIDDPNNAAAIIIDNHESPKRKKKKHEEYSDEDNGHYNDDDNGEVEMLDAEYLQEAEDEEDHLSTPVIQEVYVKEEPAEPRPRISVPRLPRHILGKSRHSKPRITRIIKNRNTNSSSNSNANTTTTSSNSLLDNRLAETLKLLRKSELTRRKDECDSFGEYIATSLRKHDERTQCMIKQAINNILFEQEMKKYGNSQQYTVVLTNMDENPLLMESGESITGSK